jgi:hypothetical protein
MVVDSAVPGVAGADLRCQGRGWRGGQDHRGRPARPRGGARRWAGVRRRGSAMPQPQVAGPPVLAGTRAA